MSAYERSYKTGRTFAGFFEILGVLVILMGIILIIVNIPGNNTNNMNSMNYMSIFERQVQSGARTAGIIIGISTIFGGLIMVLLAQHTLATLDTAEMTRDLLAIARGQVEAGLPSKPGPPVTNATYRAEPVRADGRSRVFREPETAKPPPRSPADGAVFRANSEEPRHMPRQDMPRQDMPRQDMPGVRQPDSDREADRNNAQNRDGQRGQRRGNRP